MSTDIHATNEQQANGPLNQPTRDEQQEILLQSSSDPHERAALIPDWTGSQCLAALSINLMDHFGHRTLRLHEQFAHWVKDTALGPLLHSQHDALQLWLTDSLRFARRLWRLDREATTPDDAEHEVPLQSDSLRRL